MNTQLKSNSKGFTIIEVVLVLAIAGLIFLMVFIALPALQRSQRDTQRRDDVSRFASQLTSYATNNRGTLPANGTGSGSVTEFLANYMNVGGETFADPQTGNAYTISTVTDGSATLPIGAIQYLRGVKCDGENATTTGQGNRQAAIRVKLEGSGYYCANAA